MLKILLRAPYTLLSLLNEANQNKHFSIAEKVQAFGNLANLFLQQRFKSKHSGPINANILNFKVIGFDFPTLIFLFREIFLLEVYYYRSDSKTPLIFDGGANIGISSLYFKFLYPQSRILAFEPNPEAADLFQQNVQNNNLQNITLVPVGLGKKAGETFFYPGENKGNLSASITTRNSGKKIKITVEKLSFYIKKYLPEMVKLDVEGAETGIVLELQDAGVLSLPKHYLIEYHQKYQDQAAALTKFRQIFIDAGFKQEIRKRKFTTANEDLLFHFYR